MNVESTRGGFVHRYRVNSFDCEYDTIGPRGKIVWKKEQKQIKIMKLILLTKVKF